MSERRREESVMKALTARRSRCREESGRQIGRPGRARRMAALHVSAARVERSAARDSRRAGSLGRFDRAEAPGVDPSVWTIVLAGGEGERLRPLMERWWGAHRPKQYCAFVGRRSMLRHTLERAERLGGGERMVVVVAKHHEPHIWDRLDEHHLEAIIAQPGNRGTAAGIYLPLTYIGARDSGATVVILPSDHFVLPEEAFLAAIRRAVRAVRCLPGKVVLLGARPDTAETEYGWIEPGDCVGLIDGQAVRRVAGFREKPGAEDARRLLRGGGLWNTMVMAARWETLWELGWRRFPRMMGRFEEFAPQIGGEEEMEALGALYDGLLPLNFSREVLQQAVDSLAVMELEGVLWSDWGSERRIVETLERIGKSPLFPAAPEEPLIYARRAA